MVTLVKFLRNCPEHYAFAGEEMGFADDVAAKLVKTRKASLVEHADPVQAVAEPDATALESLDEKFRELKEDAESLGVAIAEMVPHVDVAETPEPDAEDDDDDEQDEPAPRRRGRPRKNP